MPKAHAHGRPVLVVDDDPSIRRLVADVLRDEGFDVATADDGSEALRFVAVEQPAVILLDMRMPVVDGREFARAYRRRPGPHAPIVCITAEYHATDLADEVDAAAVVPKPFQLDHLIDVVVRLVQRDDAA
jgi:CheY-like chemotaxis protein